ncbi:MAG TPA: hypothetical protein PK185_10990 [Cyclobacteriaceae bacterium]|jgi:hypothetical protein|nr:hypothetical protein [Cyclobacteriaceae bacterium]
MSRSKKVFIALAILFFTGLGYISYDISSRTTFPGAKTQPKESIKPQLIAPDSIKQDSLNATHR